MIAEKQIINQQRVEEMINAHKLQFGKAPNAIVLPTPTHLSYTGISLSFHSLPSYYTVDEHNCLHHHFKQGPNEVR